MRHGRDLVILVAAAENLVIEIGFRPLLGNTSGPAAVAERPRRRQHEELKRQLDGRCRSRGPHRPDRRGYLCVGQCPHVLHEILLGA